MQESKQIFNQEQLDKKIHAEQVHSLYGHSPVSFIMQLVIASFIALTTANHLAQGSAFFWWLLVVSFIVIDFFGYIAYQSKPEHYDNPRLWFKVFLSTVIMISCVWGFGGLYLLMQLDLPYQIFMLAIMSMIAGVAVAALSVRYISLCLFLFFSLVPSIIWLSFFSGDTLHGLIAFTLSFYICALAYGGFQLNGEIRESLRLRFENEELAGSLKNSNRRLQAVNQELTMLSSTDALTKVANRRYFDERLDKEWRRLVRERGELGIVMIDVDHFKFYNDAFGHQKGDVCLSKVALCIRDSLRRPADIVARYGGEEFILLLPNTTKEGAARVAEMVRENVINLAIPRSAPRPLDVVTVSVGVGSCEPTDSIKPREVISLADKALYEAKASGRNKVCVRVLEV